MSASELNLMDEFERDLSALDLPGIEVGHEEVPGPLQGLMLCGDTVYVYHTQDQTPPVTPSVVFETEVQPPNETEHQENTSHSNNSSENISPGPGRCNKKEKARKRRVVVTPRTRHGKLRGAGDTSRKSGKLRSSSSSFALSSSSNSSDAITPPRNKKRVAFHKLNQQNAEDKGNRSQNFMNSTTVARFQCRVCGLVRFLALSNVTGLPSRLCECGSGAVVVASWVRMARGPDGGLTGGGLGRESVKCSRCKRLYCNEAHLRRHHCTKQRSSSAEVDTHQEWPGVSEVPTCVHCGEAFIFQSLLDKHNRRQH